jgi:hypothetical protein
VDAEQLDRFVLDVVDEQPSTPREFDRGPLLVHCTLNLPSALLTGVGVATLTIVSRFSFTGELAPGQTSPISAFHVVMGSVGLLMVLLPLLTYARFAGLLRHGVLTTARIVESQPARRYGAAPDTPLTSVVGTRIVEHPLGAFEERFRSDADYAPALMPGVDLAVLVHPRKPRVLRDLRPVRY